MRDDVANCMRMEVYRNIGEAMARIAKYGEVEMTALEMQKALDFVDFGKLYDFRMNALTKFDEPGVVRTIHFTSSDRNEKEINFRLDKGVGRIDFVDLDKSEVTLKDLLEIIYLHPEVNALLQSHINKKEQFSFDQCKIEVKKSSGTGYYSRNKSGVSDVNCLAQTNRKGIITQFGNKGRVLTQLLFEFGKYLQISCYSMIKPETKEEKALYEVEIMSAYNRKL
jgi:hypothetical protein